ncbi:MAG: bifunctional pyr operon transcriptional regulator/uracil phosphoribosyltransferase PyrR [Erysipelotrichales bacterium]|nr:MAG: bifunctional pyr operon transcriptional regulator/uracil phosphoribosyltransferase PyrR [Erysipelotrichales bacterium]
MKEIMDENSIKRSLIRMTHEILEKNKGVDDIVLVGIKTRGETLARRIANNIKDFEGVEVPCIGFDTRYWRDDIDRKALQKPDFNLSIDDKIVVIIDDVLYKGRTVRAAMDGLMSFGRPKAIELAVLIDRGHRELPIRADIVGKNVPTAKSEIVKVTLWEHDADEKVIILEEGEIYG